MTAIDFVRELVLDDWRFWLEEGKLRYRAPREAISEPLLLRLREAKSEIARVLAEQPEALEIAPLSHGQRALWFVWALAPNSSAYNLSLTVATSGDEATWRNACRELLRRHASLRTTFPLRNGEPLQQIHPPGEIDWKHAPDLQAAHDAPFDLERGPLTRFRWLPRNSEEPRNSLLITMHHIVSDGWSTEILRRELAQLIAGQSLPPLTTTYADYVRAQRAMLRGEEGERLLRFWQEQLAPPLPRLELPLDRPRPAVQTYSGDAVRVPLGVDLKAFAKQEEATPFAVCLAAYLALLHRLSGQRDLLIGTFTAGRGRAELAGVVGYFVDPVAIRANVEEGATFREFLREVRGVALRAIEHRDYPFALLVESLRADRDASRSPLFDVTFNYLGDVGSNNELQQADGKFDLSLTVMDGAATLAFNTDLFERATVERFAAMYATLLEAALREPQICVDALPLTIDAAFEPAIRGRAMPEPPRFLSRFEEAARRSPDAIAVIGPDETLTYRELDARASAMAQSLRSGSIVPIVVPRSAAFIVAMVAAQKAGAAYLPIDPSTPAEAREAMIRACEGMDCTDLAYVIFTSGSTGTPKGVAVGQRALANYVASIIEDLALEPGCSFAFVSSVAADLGNTMIFPALATGGTLHVIGEDVATDARAFSAAIRDVDYLKIVPSHLAAVAPALPRRAVILGGEGCTPAFVRTLRGGDAGCDVYNHYGPTETTIGVLTAKIGDDIASATLPLRTAVANTDIYLLDRNQQPVPRGVAGELCVAGAALANGYLENEVAESRGQSPPRDRETPRHRDRFVHIHGIRMYRTGDLARQRANGEIEILGREDRQVKIRGYRVEPAQIEAALLQQPGVRQCAVLADGDRLVAYVAGEADLDALAALLPSYMVPSAVVTVAALPITANGKLNVAALRRLKPAPQADERFAAPRDPYELRLARLWTAVLGSDRIGIRDDFFRIGGHSLLAVRLAARIEDEFGELLPLASFFRARTIEQMAALLRTPERDTNLVVPLQPRGDRRPLFCLPGAGGSVLYFAALSRAIGEDQPMFAVQAIGLHDDAPPPRDVESIAAQTIVAIKRTSPPPYHLVGHSFGALVAFEIARQLGGDVAGVVVLDNAAPAAGPAREYASWGTHEWLAHIATRIRKLYGVALESADDIDGFVDRMRQAGILPAGTSSAHLRRYVEIYEANAIAASKYAPPAERLPIGVTVIRAADDDPELHNEWASEAEDLGWSRYAARVTVHRAPGTHITMLTGPNARELAKLLRMEAR